MSTSIFKPDTIIGPGEMKENDSRFKNKLFLAGTIEMGASEDWQEKVIEELSPYNELAIFSPRRDKWNASLEQSMTNETFRFQVTWEQKYIDECNIVLLYLLADTKSPISLLELGQLSRHQKLTNGEDKHTIVVCPQTFYRRGNVEMVCLLYKLPLYETLQEGIAHIKTLLQIK